MHSDVGGGYPDESLSYVSLLWMMEEAEKAGLNTIKVIKDRFFALASSAGPIHDSRTGAAGYYRYQPRKIAAWLNPVDDCTAGIRDPAIVDNDSRQQKGLLMEVKVHESVIHRISCGTDRYAPITLPQRFTIFPPQSKGENKPQADSVAEAGGAASERGQVAVATRSQPLVSQALRDRLEGGRRPEGPSRSVRSGLGSRVAPARRLLHHRRLHAAPGDDARLDLTGVERGDPRGRPHVDRRADPRCRRAAARDVPRLDRHLRGQPVLHRPAGRLHLGHDALRRGPGTEAARSRPAHLAGGRRHHGSRCPIRPRRAAWRGSATRRTTSAGCRCSSGGSSPTTSSCRSSSSWPCGSAPEASPRPTCLGWRVARRCARAPVGASRGWCSTDSTFQTGDTCHAVRERVELGKRYRVELRVDENDPWFDGSHPTDPKGLRARDLGLAGILGGPFRRVIEANFLQPVIEIRQPPRVLAPEQRVHHPVGVGRKGTAALRRRVQGRGERRAVRLRQRRRCAARPDVFLHVAPRQEPRQGDPQHYAARGGPDSGDRQTHGPGTRRELRIASAASRRATLRSP